jgi:hypothetical protein
MDIGRYAMMLVRAYNPNQYSKLLERPGREFLAFFLLTITFSLVLFTIILIPLTFSYIRQLPETAQQVEQLELDANVAAAAPVALLNRPSIILALDANDTPQGEITLSNTGIIYPKYLFFGNAIIRWDDIHDLKNQTPTRDHVLAALILFLLPSIIFWFFLYSMLKLSLIFVCLLLLGYLLPRIFKYTISFVEVAKLAVLTVPSLLIMDLALFPLAPLFWWGLLLTVIFFFVGIALLSDLQEPKRQSKV